MRRDGVLLRHIHESIEWIEQFTRDDPRSYFDDRRTQSAVLRELQTLAESCKRLSDETKARRPEVFWPGISGFRNVLAHDYLGIDHDRVWAVIVHDLPTLKQATAHLLLAMES